MTTLLERKKRRLNKYLNLFVFTSAAILFLVFAAWRLAVIPRLEFRPNGREVNPYRDGTIDVWEYPSVFRYFYGYRPASGGAITFKNDVYIYESAEGSAPRELAFSAGERIDCRSFGCFPALKGGWRYVEYPAGSWGGHTGGYVRTADLLKAVSGGTASYLLRSVSADSKSYASSRWALFMCDITLCQEGYYISDSYYLTVPPYNVFLWAAITALACILRSMSAFAPRR